VLGYTMVSYDFVDNDVVEAFTGHLGSGTSYISAWYLSNNSVGMLSDRWAGYSREGSSITEYSARSGRSPTSRGSGEWVELGRAPGLHIDVDVLADERAYDESFSHVRVITEPGISRSVDGGLEELSSCTLTADDAAAAAQRWLREHLGELPGDALLSSVTAVLARRSSAEAGEVVGYTVRFTREIDGLRVRGNLVEDHMVVLVGPGGVNAYSSYWPEILVEDRAPSAPPLLTVGLATTLAADEISRSLKGGELRVIEAVPVYGTLGVRDGTGILVPAYELRGQDGAAVVIDAQTGSLLL